MTSINMMGAYSGIDMSVIDQLVEAERAKGTKFTHQKQSIERESNAWKDINTRLDSLYNKLETLTKAETFETRTVTSNVAESTALSVTAGEEAAVGTYRVNISQLAEPTRLSGGKMNEIESIYDKIASLSGSLTLTNADGKDFTIALEADHTYSLKDIENLINEHSDESGIQASIVDKRLVLTDAVYGNRSITVEGALADQLQLTGAEAKIEEGQLAEFTVNGIPIQASSNSVDHVVEGLTFELKNVHEGADEVITITTDEEKATKAVKEFVEQYNSTMDFITKQMDVGDPMLEDNTTGALTGDGTLMRLQSGLRSIMTRNLDGNFSGDLKNVEDIGITIDRYGEATLDETVFKKAFQTDPTNLARFFYSPGITPESTDEVTGEVTEAKEQEGVSELFRNFIDTYISNTSGIITTKKESYDQMLKDINEQIELFNDRVDRKRDRYIQQFTALDIAMMQAQSQLDYLYSQIGLGGQQ